MSINALVLGRAHSKQSRFEATLGAPSALKGVYEKGEVDFAHTYPVFVTSGRITLKRKLRASLLPNPAIQTSACHRSKTCIVCHAWAATHA